MQLKNIFTDAEIAQANEDLAKMRTSGAYEPGRWMVHSLSRSLGRDAGHFPARVKLRDITLRTMEQMPGVVNTPEERLGLLRSLVEAGLPEIMTSAFRRGHSLDVMRAEADLARSISPECELVYGGAATAADMDVAARTGIRIVQIWSAAYMGRAIPLVSGAVYHRVWQGRDWRDLRFPRSEEEHIDRACRMVKLAVDRGLKASMGLNRLSYASEEFVERYSRAIRTAGAFEIMLADSSGGTSPEAIGRIVEIVKESAPGLEVSIHAHNVFGLAAAGSIAAARAGAEVIEVAVNGYEFGPAGVQASLAGMAVALEALYGVPTGIDLTRLAAISELAATLTGFPIPYNEPVLGAATLESAQPDELEMEALFDPLLHAPFMPAVVGARSRTEIGVVTGPLGMSSKLAELGIAFERDHVMPILEECKRRMSKAGGKMTDDDIHAIARSVTAA